MENRLHLIQLTLVFVILSSPSSVSISDDTADTPEHPNFTGEFKMKAGSDCRYTVMHFDDEGIIGFRVKCSCKGLSKKLTYSCTYFGKPNVCPGFNDTVEVQTKFYSQLAEFVNGYGAHACSSKVIDTSKVTTLCKENSVLLKRSHTVTGDDPRTCANTHKEL